MNKKYVLIGVCSVLLLLTFTVFPRSFEKYAFCENFEVSKARVLRFEGVVNVRRAVDGEWVAASESMILNQSDRIRTGSMSSAEILLGEERDSSVIRIAENSEVVIEELTANMLTGEEKTTLDLAIGSVLVKAAKLKGESKFEVTTPTSIVGVRGTGFEVTVSAVE